MAGFINTSQLNFKNQEAAIKNLENQVGQLARQAAERPPGTFPSDTILNPKQENISAITTRSCKTLNKEEKRVEEKNDKVVKEKINEQVKARELGISSSEPNYGKVPFPKALVKKNLEKQFAKFMEVFKKLQINIPFSEALEQMPIYSKFMKEILSRRRKLRDVDETIMLTEECSAILQKKCLKKEKTRVVSLYP